MDLTTRAGAGADLLDVIANSVHARGYAVVPHAFPPESVSGWFVHLKGLEPHAFRRAAIGRGDERQLNGFVRRDEVCWLDRSDLALAAWFAWVEELRLALNRRLLLGLFDYECHFARYPRGAFYRRHVDAFRGQVRSRVLSTVLYLTPGWQPGDGGELVLYGPDDRELERVAPVAGQFVLFLSEEFPHEVLPTRRVRYSLTGWYRVNAPAGLGATAGGVPPAGV